MAKNFWKPTLQILRYRMKRTAEIFAAVCSTIEIEAIPVEWNDKGEPVRFDITFIINSELRVEISKATNWHDVVTVDAEAWEREGVAAIH